MKQLYMEIQPDWAAADASAEQIDEPSTCWVRLYDRGVDHERTETTRAPQQFQLSLASASPGGEPGETQSESNGHLVTVAERGRDWIEVLVARPTSRDEVLRTVFQAPRVTVDVLDPRGSAQSVPRPQRAKRPPLNTVDVSCDESLVVVGAADGACRLWDPTQKAALGGLEGHVMDVTRARFFPSGKVVLTASLDMTLRIWGTERRQCAAVLKGHVGGVQDVEIVGRGRNVLSCASDGAVHLWCCADQQIVAKWTTETRSAVHSIALLNESPLVSSRAEAHNNQAENEFETAGTLLFAGLDDGSVLGIDVRAREQVMTIDGRAAIFACKADQERGIPLLVTGTEDGIVSVWDVRQISSPLHALSRSTSAIHRIVIPHDDRHSVWTAHGDGVCSNWRHLLTPSNVSPFVSTELTGPEYDPVRDIAVARRSGRLFSACRDGLVREYIPHFMA
ncbi:hypothetical protein P43SY_001089 [Pythium insidiosum]|uniref:Proteasomal ATPase-associated factor 1 n=1 Tax=Pythium insidiosum TaxID=114742 RepID=A0AAD5Q2H2_PYTIN|nr:hypothetical protein P43SY_001089 [Pythium insidiosum]